MTNNPIAANPNIEPSTEPRGEPGAAPEQARSEPTNAARVHVSDETEAKHHQAARLRIRFITTRPAWPLYPGYRLRTSNLLRALCEIADVDATFVVPDDEHGEVCPPDLVPHSVQIVRVPRLSTIPALVRWARGKLPMPMTKVDWTAAAESTETLVGPDTCDLVFITPSTAWKAGSMARVPIIVDLDDLDDFKIEHRISDRSNYPSGLKGLAEQIIDRVDLRRWRHLYAEVKTTARCVVVCSATDIERLAVPHARALPNVYPVPAATEVIQARAKTTSPSALLVGDLTYRPNLEALAFLQESVMPIVWESRPDFELHVVGKNEFGDRSFDKRISVHGVVDSVTPFLEGTWMVVAPLRSGGGTRIKILEAFAHRIPVIATTVGCEGLAAVDGKDLLVADNPADFARAVLKVAENPSLIADLTNNAYQLFRSNYTFSALCSSVEQVVGFATTEVGNLSLRQ